MAGRKWSILFAFIILLIVMEAAIVYGEGSSNEYGKDQGNEKVIKEKKPEEKKPTEEEKKPIEEKKPKEEEKKPKEEEKKPKEEEKKPKEEEKKPKGEEKKPEEVKKPKEEKPKKDEKPKEVKPKEDKKPKEEKKPKEVKPKEEKKPKEVKPKEDKKPKEEKKPKEVKPKKEKKPKEEKPKKEKNPKEVKPKKEKNPKHGYDQSSDYEELTPQSGFERGLCRANSTCHFKTLRCPNECPVRKPKKNKKQKACFLDCSSKCESTCKVRKANCDGYGSLCYDPRFVGGDGVIFYFHGAKGGNFAIISDDEFQINAHFIGTRPQGRTRDYTWVQALAVMFDTHTLDIAATRVSQWDENVDSLLVKWNGKAINIPTDGDAEWRTNVDDRDVVVERTDDVNSVRVTISGLLEMDIRVRPIGEKENKAHNYQLPADDSYAHLETQFRFKNLSDSVEGVLGQTYRPAYVSPVKRGVAMPMMGGEDKYQTLSLYSTTCNLCKFKRPSAVASSEGLIAQY